ncbi:MAG TPA: LLM class F420-dependent oxidoreductase, partial [Mycobacteriales bacterium]|nr:LLM class F420-dependent oxidoreductase [Mycobacteriales bacterium]
MKFGVALRVRYDLQAEVAQAAEELGYDSLWFPEHLVWTAGFDGMSPYSDGHPPVDPTIPTYDALMWMVTIAQATSTIRVGTYVYNLALRHPFVSARLAQTLDHISGGRFDFGVGAGWNEHEYAATGVDFKSRGRRLEECIAVCRALWAGEPKAAVGHHGEFFDFDRVVFEPKPVQGSIPFHIGGYSPVALSRAGRIGDGWLGMEDSPGNVVERVAAIRKAAEGAGRDPDAITLTVGGVASTEDDVKAYAAAGISRIIVSPWRGSKNAIDGLQRYAKERGIT